MGDGGPPGVRLPGVDGASVAWGVYGGHPHTQHTVVHRVFQEALRTGALKTEPPTRDLESERQHMQHNVAASGSLAPVSSWNVDPPLKEALPMEMVEYG